jgi:hypothetical protein
MKNKYYKILVSLSTWHLKPYRFEHTVGQKTYIEYGFLCFKFIIG